MLVSILNTTDRSGGAGIAAFRLARSLELLGVASPVFCMHRRFNDPQSFRYRVRNSELSPTLQAHREALQRIQKRFVSGNRSSRSKTIFSDPWASGLLVGDNPLIAASRIIHLHWVNHFLDLHSLEELARLRRPIVWTLHDEWLYTAGCHYTSGCEQFRSRCAECPQLLHDPYRLVEAWFDQKASVIDDLDLTVVTPSAWLGERARRSRLLRDKPVHVIRNAFDIDVFKPPVPTARAAVRSEHGFDSDTIVFGFGAQSLADTRKGFGLLLGALRTLVDDGSLRGRRLGLLVFGTRSAELDALGEHVRIAYIGDLHEESAIAEVLSAMDAFVVPSLEENYPNVIIESLLCGTPVIGFGCGGIPEQIDDGHQGLVVRPVGDVPALAGAIRRFCSDEPLRQRLRRFDREVIARRHSFAQIGSETVDLYRSLAPDFDDPLDPALPAFREHQNSRKGPARDFLGLASYRIVGEGTLVRTLVADQVDAIAADRQAAERTTRERQYQDFFGETHRVAAGGDGVRFLIRGWSTPESQGVWSCEKTAGIAFQVPTGATAMRFGFVGLCKGNSQVIVLRLGGQEVGRFKASPARARHDLSIELPPFARAGGLIELTLDFPHAQRELNSPRMLGLYLSELAAEVEVASTPAAAVGAIRS